MKAILRQVRISPKKVNLVAALVRKKGATEAMEMLKFVPKKSAPVLRKLIGSAVANAQENFKQDKASLVIKEIIVTEGTTYKRRMPVSRGRSYPILKRTSHISVKVEAGEMPAMEKEEVKEVKEVKTTVKKTKKTTK